MYVNPDTTIYILKNIPLNKSYENTVYYKDAETQANAFMAYKKFTLNNYSYQRTQLGTLRVQLKYEQLYDCDYLMFKNTSFENKWFYAFITGVSYISNEVSEIYYELDVMQTWCYDYTFNPSYVERRHSEYDNLYGNTQPEGLEIGYAYDAIRTEQHNINAGNGMFYCILATEYPDGVKPGGWEWSSGSINGIYTGLYFGHTVARGDVSTISTIINQYINSGKTDAIVAFYQADAGAVQNSETYNFTKYSGTETTTQYYAPVNNKCHIYPYEKITVTNNRGIARDYRPELFIWNSQGQTGFTKYSVSFPEAQTKLSPNSYRDGNTQADNSVNFGSMPTCSFASDTFKVWWAQNRNNYLAALNSIGRTYDTNMAIAQNNYQMASRSANASAMMSSNSANTSLANATALNNTALSNAQRSTNMGIASGVAGAIGNAAGLNVGGAVNSLLGIANTGVNYLNTQDTIAAQQNAANASAGTALANTGIALSTALKNASTSQASASLSALTAKQNATAQIMAKKEDIENLPATAKGNATCGDILNLISGDAGFTIQQCQIKNEYMEKVDHYFTIYGYAYNDIPPVEWINKRVNRPHWSYLKTVGCSIKGSLNSNDQIAIQSIYDNGIETWRSLEEVGNFDLDNRPQN